MTVDIERSTDMLVASRGGRSADVAVEELNAASADAVTPTDASENFLFANPSLLLTRPVVALLLP